MLTGNPGFLRNINIKLNSINFFIKLFFFIFSPLVFCFCRNYLNAIVFSVIFGFCLSFFSLNGKRGRFFDC